MRRFAVHMGIAGALTAAWIIAQPPPPATTGELAFPSLSTPYTCSDARQGRVYYDTDDDTPYYCDSTTDAWTPFGISISGTYPFLARFTSAGTNIENTPIEGYDIPAAGASGSILQIQKTLNAMNGSDTVRGIYVNFTNADHTGSANILRGVEVTGISGDAQATEIAILAGAGWDYAWWSTNGQIRMSGNSPAAATSMNLFEVGAQLAALDGNDFVRIINGGNLITANHTGSNNTITFLYTGDLVEDAQALEQAIFIDSEWDSAITIAAKTTSSWNAPNETATNTVAFYVDETVDRGAGTGTSDCALVARLASGSEVVISVLVTDGGC